jgi:hypothetical protein
MENFKNTERKKSLKYVNDNVVVSTNEFMQLFMLNLADYREPIPKSDEILLCADKKIDNKATIRLTWDLLSLYNTEGQKILLEKKEKILSSSTVKKNISEFGLFSREEIIVYLILFNHYAENIDHLDNDKNIVITFKDIHCKYRNKTLKMYSQVDASTNNTYNLAIKSLSSKRVSINTDMCKKNISYIRKREIASFTDFLLNYTAIKNNDGKKATSIKYNLGKFGELLLRSKRMTSKFPVELLERPYKQIGQVFIGLYISKMIFINQKRRGIDDGLTISIPAILRNIIYYDLKGKNTGQTLLERLGNKEKQSYTLLKTFNANLSEVLELYKKHNFIKDYTKDDITLISYKLKSTKLKLFVK